MSILKGMRRALLVALFALGIFGICEGQGEHYCYSCTETDFNGEPLRSKDCFNNVLGSTANLNRTCYNHYTSPYCYSDFTINNGALITVSRGCYDLGASPVPSNPLCSTAFASSSLATTSLSRRGAIQTTCRYTCQPNNCNFMPTRNFKLCQSDCSVGFGRGWCDYLTGQCVCSSGFTGPNCTTPVIAFTPTYRSCVQCSGETDAGCATKTTGHKCSSAADRFCSVTHTTLKDANGKFVRSIVTRGCTNKLVVRDQCFFITPYDIRYSRYLQYNCISTCATDNCNTGTPDGVVTGSEKKALYCHQCWDTNEHGSCTNTVYRTLCPAASTHCYSIATYFISPKNDLSYVGADPEYRFVSIERGCSQTAMAKQCTSTLVGTSSGLKTVCQESCQTDGCNDGWPNRPKCSQCRSSGVTSGYDWCLSNPSIPTQCPRPYEAYCYYEDIGRTGAMAATARFTGFARIMYRGCSYYDRGTGCSNNYRGQALVTQCNKTCTVIGCNQGFGDPAKTYASALGGVDRRGLHKFWWISLFVSVGYGLESLSNTHL